MRNPTAFLSEEYNKLVESSLDWRPKTLEGLSKPHAMVEGRELLMLCTNNYLGFSSHPKLIEAAVEAAKKYGAGSGSVRPISGTMDIHLELEEMLAKFKGSEASLAYPTGFMVNSGLIPQLAGKGDLIISDQLNHGSIIDGVRLTKADRAVYKHNNMEELAKVLEDAEKHEPGYNRILIITDGVFSMDGDIAPLDEVAKLGKKHGAMVYVDDAHGDGVLGEKGKGIVDHFDLTHNDVHVEGGTFSKAFGVIGGHISGSRDLVNYAYNKSRTWLLTGAQAPAVVGACIAAVDVLENEPEHVKNLWKNTEYFRKGAQDLGFDTGNSQTPIVPLMCGESEKAKALSNKLFEMGIYILPIVFPMVARDKARIRAQMNAQLTQEDLDRTLEALEKAGKEVGVL